MSEIFDYQRLKAGDSDIPILSFRPERSNVGFSQKDIMTVLLPAEVLITEAQLEDMLLNPWTITDVDGAERKFVGYSGLLSSSLTFVKSDDTLKLIGDLEQLTEAQSSAIASLSQEKETLSSEKAVLSDNVASMRRSVSVFLKGKTDDTLVALLDLMEEWTLTDSNGANLKYTVGEPRKHNGQPYSCVQSHSTDGDPNRAPDLAPALWMIYHARSAQYALPWIAPTGAHDMYKEGEYMIFTDTFTYKCLSDTNYSPSEYAAVWQKIS